MVARHPKQAAEKHAKAFAAEHEHPWDYFAQTDAGNAELFATLFADELRFDHARLQWLIWRDHWWELDREREVDDWALVAARVRQEKLLDVTRDMEPEERNRAWRFCRGNESKARLRSTLDLAGSGGKLGIAADAKWNADPYLLGVANGVLDLRTGQLRAGKRDDLITRRVPVAFDPKATCPRWKQFLAEITDNDPAYVEFLARAVGYSLSGDTGATVLFFLHGPKKNGKSVFIWLLETLLGEYGITTQFETLESAVRSGGNVSGIAPAILAFEGARAITASESGAAAKFNAELLKRLTGGDRMSGRMPYGPMIYFTPIAKFWLMSNFRPRANADDEGFFRRILLCPLMVQFGTPGAPAEVPRPLLEAALRAELPGILNWGLGGFRRWYGDMATSSPRAALQVPPIITQATDDYRSENDPIAEFVAECVVTAPRDTTIGSRQLYRIYQRWCRENEISEREQLGTKSFSQCVASRFERWRSSKGRGFRGLAIVTNGTGNEYTLPEPVQEELGL